jgi:hypothetical protein
MLKNGASAAIRNVQTQDGDSRYPLEIVAGEIKFLTSKPAGLAPAVAA